LVINTNYTEMHGQQYIYI